VTDRVVLGLSGTVDYVITWDSSVLEGLVREHDLTAADLSTSLDVDSERNLVRVLLAFVRDGTGGERFVASSGIVEEFASRFEKEIALGGTCTRAGLAMDKLGVASTLHLVSIDDHVRRLLPRRCRYICSAERDSTDPHLIVQFGAGTRVRAADIDLCAPHPNRVIFANDPPHEELRISEDLGGILAEAQLFLVSGFNVMRDADLLDQRLTTLQRHMAALPRKCLVHFEDAGYHVPALSHRVNHRLGPLVDVHSMNEDELQVYVGRTCDLLDVEDMASVLADLRALILAPTIVVHTRYWSLALGPDPERYVPALRGGITMASTRYLHGDGFSAAHYEQMLEAPERLAGAALAAALEARLPGRVRCLLAKDLQTSHPTTVGLGDAFVGGFLEAWRRCPAGGPSARVVAPATGPAADRTYSSSSSASLNSGS
jgi:ADP-dependent phosphofructokinase/glucokinase